MTGPASPTAGDSAPEDPKRKTPLGETVEIIRTVVYALLIALVIRSLRAIWRAAQGLADVRGRSVHEASEPTTARILQTVYLEALTGDVARTEVTSSTGGRRLEVEAVHRRCLVDRWFLREPMDSADCMARLEQRLRAGESLRDLAAVAPRLRWIHITNAVDAASAA